MLELYREVASEYPNTLSNLARPFHGRGPLVAPDYVFDDAWGRPFVYHVAAGPNGSRYELLSVGRDGVAGTSDDVLIGRPCRGGCGCLSP